MQSQFPVILKKLFYTTLTLLLLTYCSITVKLL